MEPFIGQIMPVGFNFAPRGWALCDGQLLSISAYTSLFSLLGTTFGGDGRTTFGLPDLRGRSIVHIGTGPGLSTISWGERAGSNTNTLSVTQLPSHNHGLTGSVKLPVSDQNGNTDSPSNAFLTATSGDFYHDAATAGETAGALSGDLAVGYTGNNSSINNMPPFLGIYVCIALTGIYPSRN